MKICQCKFSEHGLHLNVNVCTVFKIAKLLWSTFTQFSLFYWPAVLHCTKALQQNNAVHGLVVFVHIQTHRVCFLSLFAVCQSTSAMGACSCLGKKIERAIERERAFILCRWYPGLAHILWIIATSITPYVFHDAWSGKRKQDYWKKELEVPSRFQKNTGIYCVLIKKQGLTCILVFRVITFLFRDS